MNSLKSNYKPVWYVLSLIGIVFIMITVMGFTSFVSLDMVLAFGNNASNQNITGVDYIDANYFVGDGSLLTNLPTGNIVQVTKESDLPAPVGGEIQLEDNTVYYFKGFVVSANTLVLGNPSPLIGSHASTDGFIHVGGATAIKSNGNPFFMRNFFAHAPSGTLFNLTANNKTEFLVESSAFMDAPNLGSMNSLGVIDGYRVPTIKGSNFENFNAGLTFNGSSAKIFIASSPFRNVGAENITVLTFGDNLRTEIVSLIDNYFTELMPNTKIINVSSSAVISNIFQYNGNTHGDSVNKSNILVGSASVSEVGYTVDNSYPLRNSIVSGTVKSNSITEIVIVGSGTSWTDITLPSELNGAERITQPANSTLQYIGKKDLNAIVESRVVVTGVSSDDIRTRILKNGIPIFTTTGLGSTFNPKSYNTILDIQGVLLESFDNISVQIQNFDGSGDISVKQVSIIITK